MAITNATRLSDFAAGIGTEGAILKVDNANQRIGIGTQLPNQMLTVAGIVSATQYIGDGSQLEGITSAGLGTAVSDVDGSVGAVVYYTDDLLTVAETTTINPPASASAAYTQYRDVKLDDSVDLIIETGDDFIPDVLGFGDDTSNPNAAGNGVFDEVYTSIIKSKDGLGAPTFANGLTSVGVGTFSSDVSIGGTLSVTGNVSVGGTLTYEDVKNVDSVGLITARTGIKVTAGGIDITAGAITASGDGINAASNLILNTVGSERLRIASAGQIGIGGANYGTSGQVMTSQGASAAPQWADAGGGAWEYVKTTTVNNAATCHCTMPTYTGFGTALYAAHKFIIRGLRWAGGNDQAVLNMRFSLNNGVSADTSANYRGATTQQTFSGNSGTGPLGQTFSGKTVIPIMQGGSSDVGVRSINYMEVLIPAQLNYGHTDKQNMYPTYLFNDSVIYGSNGSYWRIDGGGMHMAAYTNHITGLELLDVATSKNFQHCSIVLYRMKLT